MARSLDRLMRNARKAQQEHEQKHDVQLEVTCGNCGEPIAEHCTIHLVPCCPHYSDGTPNSQCPHFRG